MSRRGAHSRRAPGSLHGTRDLSSSFCLLADVPLRGWGLWQVRTHHKAPFPKRKRLQKCEGKVKHSDEGSVHEATAHPCTDTALFAALAAHLHHPRNEL